MKALFDNLHILIASPLTNSSPSTSLTPSLTQHLLYTHVLVPTCKALNLDEEELLSTISLSLQTSQIQLTTFQNSTISSTHSKSQSQSQQSQISNSFSSLFIEIQNTPIITSYILYGSVEIIPLNSISLKHLDGSYSGMLNSSSKSYCRLGHCQPPVSNESKLLEEYWRQMMLSIDNSSNSDSTTILSPSSPIKNSLKNIRSITYSSGSLWLSSQYYIQKGFTATIHYQGKNIANTIEYLTRFPDILEGFLKDEEEKVMSSSIKETTNSISPLFLGKEFQSSNIGTTSFIPEILLGGINCCVFTGSQSSRQNNLTNRIIGANFPTITVSEALGLNLLGSVSVGVSYHGKFY